MRHTSNLAFIFFTVAATSYFLLVFQCVIKSKLVNGQVILYLRRFYIAVKNSFYINKVVYLHAKAQRETMVQPVCFHIGQKLPDAFAAAVCGNIAPCYPKMPMFLALLRSHAPV